MKHAAVTILSRNYLSLGLTLAESWREHHPTQPFFIVLVDHTDGLEGMDAKGATVLGIADVGLPDFSNFLYRYTILELNTAVKPYVLDFLFQNTDADTVSYIDPDIWIKSELTEVFNGLEEANIVMTPHMRRPFWDGKNPTETGILQSGTYNLGFLGLRRSNDAKELLYWWMDKLFLDCIVDIPNGLFVDQKWMDLVPGYFQSTKIIHNPGYNIAYWNLHERELEVENGQYSVEGSPLGFFHFSGYSPYLPSSLSKHQNRHNLADMPVVRQICDEYGAALLRNGYAEYAEFEYGFETLPNGVKLPLGIVRDALQDLYRREILVPDPLEKPEEFCKFFFTPKALPFTPIPPFNYYLLQRRPDVAAAFPNAQTDAKDPGFEGWLYANGKKEEKCEDFIQYAGQPEDVDAVSEAFRLLRENNRQDVFDHYAELWDDPKVFEEFSQWLEVHGTVELGLAIGTGELFLKAKQNINRLLGLYFLRGDLQSAFNTLEVPDVAKGFAGWLRSNIGTPGVDVSKSDVSLFEEFILAKPELIAKMRFLYSHYGKAKRPVPTVFDIDTTRGLTSCTLDTAAMTNWLIKGDVISAADQYDYAIKTRAIREDQDIILGGVKPKNNFDFVNALRDEQEKPRKVVVNVAGMFDARIGMGESARSMLRTLEETDLEIHKYTIPHHSDVGEIPTEPDFLGYISPKADVSIAVLNADSSEKLLNIVPDAFWHAEKKIGYWVWETEKLPSAFKNAQDLFDEIWTPSEYSAEAIRATIDKPVKVLPHTLDFDELENAAPDRIGFDLPDDELLFGYMFDPQSVLERKNVDGLIKAFRMAFDGKPGVRLVLKINDRMVTGLEAGRVLQAAEEIGAILVRQSMTRSEVVDFMSSLDVYVSLHRSEGFGLTCAEAMALGKPVIASNYSGNLEFMNNENSLLVDTARIVTKRPYGAYQTGSAWGDPDVKHAAKLMQEMLDETARKEVGEAAAESIKELAPNELGRILLDLLEL